ncbi:MAG: hypothetical protein QOC95_383 [Thermoleophilaceae bacterium]|nr:hypothetical protein [Thermoleophilaceae bacterium]
MKPQPDFGTTPALQAEGEGFEPSVRHDRTTVFETAPFNHSGTPPCGPPCMPGLGGAKASGPGSRISA